MRALVCETIGGDVLVREIEDAPPPAHKDVRLNVHAAGLNFPDVLMVAGKYQVRPETPFVPGIEAAGTVTDCGEGVSAVKPGDRVIALVDHGAFSEQLLVPEHCLIKIHDDMPFDIAAGFAVAYLSAWYGLVPRCRLAAGETLLVLGAAGGIGLAAVEIGAALGSRVIAAARGADKLEICRAHGAADTVDYEAEDLAKTVKALTGGKGADVIFDPVGGARSKDCLRCVAQEGRIGIVGFAAGEIQQIPANMILLKNCDLIGVNGSAFTSRQPAGAQRAADQLTGWYLEGRLKPHISHRLPLEKAGEGFNLITSRHATGKIVLTVQDEPG